MVAQAGTSKTGKVHRYYACVRQKKHKCDKKMLPKEKLEEYQIETADFYKPYAQALRLGREDGSVRDGINEELTYLAVNHTMLALLRKAAEGKILTQDEKYEAEISLIKEIILSYFKTTGGNAK